MSGEILDVERVETGTAAVTAVLERISKARITGDVSAGVLEYGQSVKSRTVDAKVKGTAQGQPKKKDVEVGTTARSENSLNTEPADVPRATMRAFGLVLPQGCVKVKDTDIGDVYAKLDKNGDPHAMVQFDGEIVADDRKAYEKNIIARMKDYRAARITIAGSIALQLSSYSEDSGTIFFIFPVMSWSCWPQQK